MRIANNQKIYNKKQFNKFNNCFNNLNKYLKDNEEFEYPEDNNECIKELEKENKNK